MDRPKFAASRVQVEEAFYDVIRDVDCTPIERIELLKAFDDAQQKGEIGRSFERRISSIFHQREWSWAWAAEWAARFDTLGQWPYMWDRRGNPNDEDDPTPILWHGFLCMLLAHTLFMRMYTVQNRDSFVESGQQDIRLVNAGCPVERQIVESLSPEKLAMLPPYFPGDRTRFRSQK